MEWKKISDEFPSDVTWVEEGRETSRTKTEETESPGETERGSAEDSISSRNKWSWKARVRKIQRNTFTFASLGIRASDSKETTAVLAVVEDG